MDFLQTLDSTTLLVLISASLVILLVLFATFIKGLLKIAIIAVMAVGILYFLHRAGIL